MENNICYTAIIGNYDNLIEVEKQEGWRYICFTDLDLKSDTWEIIKVNEENIDNKLCRKIKLLPHKYLPNHDFSLWIDGNLSIECYLNKFLIYDYCLMKHPERDNIFEEASICIEAQRDNIDTITKQIEKYKSITGFFSGLNATGILARKNTIKNIDFNEKWWNEVKEHSRRDQISFSFLAHIEQFEFNSIEFLEGFIWNEHLKGDLCIK